MTRYAFNTVQISSTKNDKLKALLGDDRLMVFEGKKLCQDLLRQKGIEIKTLIVLEDQRDDIDLSMVQPVQELWIVTASVMAKISSMKSIPSMVAVLDFSPRKIEFKRCRSLLALFNLQDPGNVGTLVRTACAFGFDGVALIGASVNMANRKLIRSAQNALLEIPLHYFDSFVDFSDRCKKYHIAVYLSSAEPRPDSVGPEAVNTPCAVVLGSEGSGFDESLLNQFPTVRVPQADALDSLNVAVSGGILMHEIRKKWGYE